jgi:hypothetical protein
LRHYKQDSAAKDARKSVESARLLVLLWTGI